MLNSSNTATRVDLLRQTPTHSNRHTSLLRNNQRSFNNSHTAVHIKNTCKLTILKETKCTCTAHKITYKNCFYHEQQKFSLNKQCFCIYNLIFSSNRVNFPLQTINRHKYCINQNPVLYILKLQEKLFVRSLNNFFLHTILYIITIQ